MEINSSFDIKSLFGEISFNLFFEYEFDLKLPPIKKKMTRKEVLSFYF